MRTTLVPLGRLLVLLALAAASGCPSAGPTLRSGNAGDGVGVEVSNDTETAICQLRASRCDLDPPTSFDLLGGGGELAGGSSATVVIPPGCWNLKAQDCDGNFVTGLAGVVVEESGTALRLTP
jgi:hypothetical protein